MAYFYSTVWKGCYSTSMFTSYHDKYSVETRLSFSLYLWVLHFQIVFPNFQLLSSLGHRLTTIVVVYYKISHSHVEQVGPTGLLNVQCLWGCSPMSLVKSVNIIWTHRIRFLYATRDSIEQPLNEPSP